MKELFGINGPVLEKFTNGASLLWLNLLTLLCCVPIITAGAAITALHYMTLKIVRDEDCYLVQGYFKAFKDNFKKATILWLIILLGVGVVILDFWVINNAPVEFPIVIKGAVTFLGIVIIATAQFIFPMQAKFENTIVQTIKNSALAAMINFPKTIIMVAVMAAFPIVIYFHPRFILFALLFAFSGHAYISALLYDSFFKKLEAQSQ